MSQRAVILLAEDLEDDVLLISKAFRDVTVPHRLVVVRNGREAVNYLAGRGRFADRMNFPFPSVFLLDLKLPEVDGFEVLEWMQKRRLVSRLPVLVLSSIENGKQVKRALGLGAREFLEKPYEFRLMVALANAIALCWVRNGPQVKQLEQRIVRTSFQLSRP